MLRNEFASYDTLSEQAVMTADGFLLGALQTISKRMPELDKQSNLALRVQMAAVLVKAASEDFANGCRMKAFEEHYGPAATALSGAFETFASALDK